MDCDPRNHYLLSSWGDAHEVTLVCATPGPANSNLVSFDNNVQSSKMGIREPGKRHSDILFEGLGAMYLS